MVTGDRAYAVGTEAGRFPAMGLHMRGEISTRKTNPVQEVLVEASDGGEHTLVVKTVLMRGGAQSTFNEEFAWG